MPPPAPSWREFFIKEGIRHKTENEIERIWADYGIEPEDFDDPVDDRYWPHHFEMEGGPCAKAHRLLSKIDFGPDLGPGTRRILNFMRAAQPGDSS